jgi:hypothetical protein
MIRQYGSDAEVSAWPSRTPTLTKSYQQGSTAVPSQRRSNSRELNKERQPAADTVIEPDAIQDVWESLKAFLMALGDDVQMKELEHYIAFRLAFTSQDRHQPDWERLASLK